MTITPTVSRRSLLRLLGAATAAATVGSAASCGERTWSEVARADVARAAPDPSALSAGVRVVDLTTGRLFAALPRRDNVVCSPYSITLALAMALNGAEGQTAEEIRRVLRAPGVTELDAGLNAVTSSVSEIAGPVAAGDDDAEIVLDVVSAVFAQVDLAWEQPFLDALARYYGAGVQLADFRRDPEGERAAINAWVADATADAIRNLLPPGSVTSETALALVNALHLKAPWAEQFAVDDTTEAQFHPREGESLTVPMMHQTYDDAEVATHEHWTAARLPFAGGRLAMALLLPERGYDDVIETQLRMHGTSELLSGLRRGTRLDLAMPRFSFSFGTPLRDLLSGLGMGRAFGRQAEFGGISREADLSISQVFHRARIDVDEQGAEAAAATAVVMMPTSARPPERTITLTLDRPFYFVVMDTRTRTPLFIGRVVRPGGS